MSTLSSLLSERKNFFIKSAILAFAVGLFMVWFASRFTIGIDPQVNRCLPWTFYLVDTKQTEIKNGQYVAYTTVGMQPVVEDGQIALKRLSASEGDTVEITGSQTLVNGMPQINGRLQPIDWIDDPEALKRTYTLEEGEMFVMGTLDGSYDSRYVGPLSTSTIQGRAYPLF